MPGRKQRATSSALIFDFDGVILDTETPEYQSWCEVYESFGQILPIERWSLAFGKGRGEGFDPYAYLEELLGAPVDREAIRSVRRSRSTELREGLTLLEGVAGCMQQARQLGWKVGLASSSDSDWVQEHLRRYQLASSFDAVVCAGAELKPKPDPAVYLRALQELEASATDAVALEDSPNGIAAAKAAGVYCVAVPSRLTLRLNLSAADLIVPSLLVLSLTRLPIESRAAPGPGGA